MYAQLVEGGTTPELREQMDRIVLEELLPALQAEPGFAGTLNLVDRSTGKALMLMLWETRAHAELPLRERGPAFLQALGSIMAISTGARAPISFWDVNAFQVVSMPPSTGSTAPVT
jgi:hypothetical protein